MAKHQDQESQFGNDEELLDLDFEDLSLPEGLEDDLGMEEEIIELSDLVERGSLEDTTRDLDIRERPLTGLEQQENQISRGRPEVEKNSVAGGDTDLSLLDLSLELDEEPEAEKEQGLLGDEITEADLEGIFQEEGITLDFAEEEKLEFNEKPEDEISEADLQALLSEAGGQGTLIQTMDDLQDQEVDGSEETQILDLNPSVQEALLTGESADILQDVDEGFGATEMEEETASYEAEDWGGDAVSGFAEEHEDEPYEEDTFSDVELPGISEEKLEEIIRKVVGEVVERVARETMAEVAERMIGEAIDSLKKQLEFPEP